MDDGEGGLSFDFEGNLDGGPAQPTASVPVVQSSADPNATPSSMAAVANINNNNTSNMPYAAAAGDRRSFRKTVCRHWLRSLCMKGDACGFLHQYDKSRMPVCRFFRLYGECREQDCVYKHTNEDIKECNMYKLGFCPNGPDCRYRHAKLPGPPPPVEEVLQKIKLMTSYGHGKPFQNRNSNFSQQQAEKTQLPQGTNGVNQVGKANMTESGNVLQQQQQSSQGPTQNVQNGLQNQASRTAIPLPHGTSRYFVVKSCNRENLELSVQQGVWATQRSNEAKLNEAFESVENVILIFSVNKTRHFQGCAKMISRIGGSAVGGNWKYAHGTAHYGRNFSVKWLKLCELSFEKTRHLRNPYNENLPVKISRDCQELEPSIGEQLASLLYLEPDSELMAISHAAELKREEEKAKGVNQDNATVNPDIVPFEDNEEEEEDDEEESEDEEESFTQGFGPLGRGRGGRGVMWPPHMPFAARGPGPFPPMRGFPPNIMGGDGFSYGPPMNPVGFPMPGMNPRGFGPYDPRFSGDFPGPMFLGRPSGGFNMMMGPHRPMGPRGGRPMHMPPAPPFYPSSSLQQPSHAPNRSGRDQRTPPPNDRFDQGKGQETVDEERYQHHRGKSQQEDRYKRNDESESEDEAPRRSRHGEGKKKRRSSEVEDATGEVEM